MKKNYLLLLGIWLSVVPLYAQPFWAEDFSDGSFPAGWTTEDATSIGLLWEHCSNLYDCPPYTQKINFKETDIDLKRFEARTAFNGYVLANSAALPADPMAFDSQLNTPQIDCSGKNEVVLAFSSNLIYEFREPAEAAFVRVKNEANNYVTFPVYPTWDDGLPTLFPTSTWNGSTIYIDISAAAAGFSAVEIQWQWQGSNDWIWALDDIEIFDYHPLYERALWGAAPGEGDFDSGLNGWQLGANNPECPWEWIAKGEVDSQHPFQADYLSICSNTPENGAMVVNPTNCQGAQTFALLISPSIDLSSAAPDCEISLKFFQQVQVGNSAFTNTPLMSINWSVNGGSWEDPVNVNPLGEFMEITCGEKSIPLPSSLIGESDVRFRFVFQAGSFYWAIDDVRVMQNESDDLELKDNFYAIAPNFQTPKSQIDSFGLLVDFQNIGKEIQENVQVAARIYDGENQGILHEDFLGYNEVAVGELVENKLFLNLAKLPSEVGKYYGEYEISGAEPDKHLANNIINWEFEITDSIFAKERGFRTGFVPNGPANYEMGNCFYIPKGDGFNASEITFGLANYPEFQGAILNTRLYKWNISDPLDDIAELDELEQIGGNFFVNNDNSLGNKFVTVELEPVSDEDDKVYLEDDTYYLATVAYLNPINCDNGDCPFFIGASEEFNYAANYFLSRNLTESPRFASVLRQGDSEDFNTIGFNLKRTPVVRLHISNNIVGTNSPEIEVLDWSIFPNPAEQEIFIQLNAPFNLKDAQVVIYDGKGVKMTKQVISDGFAEQIRVSTNQLSSGLYVIEVLLSNGQRFSKGFVKKT